MIETVKKWAQGHPGEDDEQWRVYYNRNRVRFAIIFIVVMLAVLGNILWNQNQLDKAADKAREQCRQRAANIERLNKFYRGLADIERHNPYIDDKIRRERVKLYVGNVFTVPVC
jgi:hypothetical protein